MNHREIAGRFNRAFARPADTDEVAPTRLIGGASEPLYLPAAPGRPAALRYTRDYPQSALHELAHWCLATPARRARVDYGLRYRAPPRSPGQQARFYAAEVPVQALEMLFAHVCGLPFHFSADNPGADHGSQRRDFEARVVAAFDGLLQGGPGRLADRVLEALRPGWCDEPVLHGARLSG